MDARAGWHLSVAAGLLAVTLLAGAALNADAGKMGAEKKLPGPALFQKHCSKCHGMRGEGKDGPPLRGLKHSATEIAETVRIGVPGDMPAFGKVLTAAEVKAVSDYAHSLQRPPAK
jgi:mono/diheme cytochrome c family protein